MSNSTQSLHNISQDVCRFVLVYYGFAQAGCKMQLCSKAWDTGAEGPHLELPSVMTIKMYVRNFRMLLTQWVK